MMKEQIFHYLLIASCFSLFTYELVKAILAYYDGQVVTTTTQEKQEHYLRPKICISSKYLMRRNQTSEIFGENFTHVDYQNGKWISNKTNLTEEQIFDIVAPKLSDLLSRLTIQKTSNASGEDYEVIELNVSSIEGHGIEISRCDYYEYLKCYCLAMNDQVFPHGVQGVHLYPPQDDIIAFIVPPGKFYDFTRKLNKLEIQYGAGYEYVIKYDIFKVLNMEKRPCNAEISWREDTCKIKKVKKTE